MNEPLPLVTSLSGNVPTYSEQMLECLPGLGWLIHRSGKLEGVNRRWQTLTGITKWREDDALWRKIIHPDDFRPFNQAWQNALVTEEVHDVEVRFKSNLDGNFHWFAIQFTPLKLAGAPAEYWVCSGLDVTSQNRISQMVSNSTEKSIPLQLIEEHNQLVLETNQHLFDEIQNYAENLERLEANTKRLNEIIKTQSLLAQAQLDLDKFLALAVDQMLALTPASGAAVELIDKDEIVYRAVAGTITPFADLRLKMDGSLSGFCMKTRELALSEDTSADARVDAEACRKVGARSMAVTPLIVSGNVVGALKITGDIPLAFNHDDLQTLQLMSGLIGAALGNQLAFEANGRLLLERTQTLKILQQEIRLRAETEDTLRKNIYKTARIIEVSQDAYICINSNGIVIAWNTQAETTFGWSAAEAIGQRLERLIIPAHYCDAHLNGLKRYMQTGEGPVLNQRLELVAVSKGGREIPVELIISAMGEGAETEFSCFLHDISERKFAEHERLLREELMRNMTDALPAAIALIDKDEVFRYCNKTYLDTFQLELNDIIGKPLKWLYSAERYHDIQMLLERARLGERSSFEWHFSTGEEVRYFEGRYIPQWDGKHNITGYYIVKWDITERHLKEQHLANKAALDALTGLYNRSALHDALRESMLRHRKNSQNMAVLYLDVDKFKQINDSMGHRVGDQVLQVFATRIKNSIRATDTAARLGGDEFVIVLDSLPSVDGAIAVAEKVIQSVSQPITIDEGKLVITTSIGVAYAHAPGMSAEQLLEEADKALYQSKQNGRNQYSVRGV